jgi:hypothetical protein
MVLLFHISNGDFDNDGFPAMEAVDHFFTFPRIRGIIRPKEAKTHMEKLDAMGAANLEGLFRLGHNSSLFDNRPACAGLRPLNSKGEEKNFQPNCKFQR